MLVDSHAHLDDERFGEDRVDVLARAWDAGVRSILTIGNGTGPDDMACGLPIAAAFDWVVTSVGVHPHDAEHMTSGHLGTIEELARDPKVVGIGEMGLDYYYDNSPRDVQRRVFQAQLELAARLELPAIIHTRDADPDTISILNQVRPRRGVIHCFTGSMALAECALELGFRISFSGILTFGSAGAIRDVAREVPVDRIMVETDSPYLAPVPHRGRRNEPAFVAETVSVLAEIRGETPDQIEAWTTRNFSELFEIPL